jgi:hypothetical protein
LQVPDFNAYTALHPLPCKGNERVTVQLSVSLFDDLHTFFIFPSNLVLSRFHAKISAMQIPKTNRLYHPSHLPPRPANLNCTGIAQLAKYAIDPMPLPT